MQILSIARTSRRIILIIVCKVRIIDFRANGFVGELYRQPIAPITFLCASIRVPGIYKAHRDAMKKWTQLERAPEKPAWRGMVDSYAHRILSLGKNDSFQFAAVRAKDALDMSWPNQYRSRDTRPGDRLVVVSVALLEHNVAVFDETQVWHLTNSHWVIFGGGTARIAGRFLLVRTHLLMRALRSMGRGGG